ncbi:MAG: rod-binding protein, partial [Steroidobacteraceae bacterium]
MTLPITDPGLFADAQSLATLKSQAAAHNPKALRAAAQQFESLFIGMMLKSAQDANFKDPLFGSSQQRMYQDLYDQQLSVQLSKTHTFGLAEMLVQQLRRQWSASGTPATSGAANSSALGGAGTTSAVSAAAVPGATPSPTATTDPKRLGPVNAAQ